MCGMGRHQLEDDVPAPRKRSRAPRTRRTRKAQREVKTKLHQALAAEVHALPAGQALAQEQFAQQYELLPPGLDLIDDNAPVIDTRPYWAKDND